MVQRIRNISILAMLFFLWLPMIALSQETDKVITQEMLGGRRALVGPDCIVNQFASNVQLLSGISHLEHLVDEDLDNFATFTTGVAVGVTEQPLFSVKDVKHTYAAGTEAGVCMVSSESGGLLSLSVIQLFTIRAYNNGKLIATYPVSSGQAGSGVGLDLIKIPGSDNMAVNLTCTPQEDFDELYLDISGGLDLSVIKELKFKYAFVGKPRQCMLTDNGIKKYAAETNQAGPNGENAVMTPKGAAVPVLIPLPIINSELNKLVDDNKNNSCSVTNILSIGYKGAVKLSTDSTEPACGIKNKKPKPTVVFPAGSEVGFLYQNASALNLKLGNYVEIKVFNTDGTTQTERVEAGVLSLTVGEGGKMTSSVIAKKEFYAAELAFYTVVSANLGNLGVYYGFVNEKPEVPHRCDINPSVNAELCTTQATYQLLSNPKLSVEWKLDKAFEYGTDIPLPKDSVSVTPSGKVTYHCKVPSTCTFVATSVGCKHVPQCTDTVVQTRGISSYDVGCAEPLLNSLTKKEYVLSNDLHGISGSLISISDLKNAEKILDDSLQNYATYTGGLSLASNLGVIGIKKTNGVFKLSDEKEGVRKNKRIGFIVESKSTFLNADVLQFFQIRCYKDGKEVYRKMIDATNAVGVGLIEGDQSQKVRFSIEVPANDKDGNPIDFDEFILWTAGVLKLDISIINIYYGFIEDASLDCGNPLKCARSITTDNGATAYPDLKFQTASVAGVVQNLSYLLDNDMETYFRYQNTVQVGSGMVVTVKLGKTLDYKNQFGIVMDSETFLASVGAGTWMTVETYYQGERTGDKFDNWGVLGLNLIGYGDKSYLVNQPTKNFDEVRITFAGIANALNSYKLYGLFFRNDKNLNGIPDCMDPIANCSEDLGLQVSKVCVGDSILLTGTVPSSHADYMIKVVAPDQGFSKDSIKVGGKPFEVKIPTKKAGVGMNIMVYGDAKQYLDGVTYNVHPTQTQWRKTPLNTNWNEPNNWEGNVDPYCCTNVIIPDGATKYPVLPTLEPTKLEDGTLVPAPLDTYCCDGIYFKSSKEADEDNPAQVVNIPELAYHKAWVDVRMMPNRYYLFAAPLKHTYTGDMFVPRNMHGMQTGLEFVDLNNDNTPQNRFHPSVFQRMWKTNPWVRLLDEIDFSKTEEPRDDIYAAAGLEKVETQEAGWSKVFNTMAHEYVQKDGFSIWVDNGKLSPDNPVIIRLPKQHTVYHYYTPGDVVLPEFDGGPNTDKTKYGDSVQLVRTDNTRFIYEQKTAQANTNYESLKADSPFDAAGKLKLTATTEEASSQFVVNNPFMSDLDIATFLEENTDVKTLYRYNGYTYVSYQKDGTTGTLVTTTGVPNDSISVIGKPVIHPLESFFIGMNGSGTNQEVIISRAMMLNTVPKEQTEKPAKTSLLQLQVRCAEKHASILLADSSMTVEAESLLDGDVRPTLALFAALNDKAYDMLTVPSGEIPLGLLANKQDTITVYCQAQGTMQADAWELYDRANNNIYPLDEPVTLTGVGTTVGRFVLRPVSNRNIQAAQQTSVYAEYLGNGRMQFTSQGAELRSVEVFTLSGTLCSKQQTKGNRMMVTVPQGTTVLLHCVLANGKHTTMKVAVP